MAKSFQILGFIPLLVLSVCSQSAPPLQWLNITNLLQGSAKPIPLKDSVIGFDSTTSTVIIFGGESSSGIPQSTTYLLNVNTLTWSSPSPPTGLTSTPPARSAAIAGNDFAASNRQGLIVIGGRDLNSNSLSDVWEFDYGHQFWTQVNITPSGGPSARFGAAGGIDTRSSSIPDPVLPGPNNTFYYAGGFDGKTLQSLSDVWRLNVSGVLSSNSAHTVIGSWQQIPISKLDALSTKRLGSAMVMDSVVLSGGCNTTSSTNISCATQETYVIDTDTKAFISPPPCPAPRVGAAMVPNLNSVSNTESQAMLLLGTFNTSLWSDGSGLENGEVDILDISAGTWTRVIPSGDPGSSGLSNSIPSPREGSAVFSSGSPLFGNSTAKYSDTLVFGGRDSSGNYLDELWVLRSYAGSVSRSNPKWSGFGDGNLQTGVNASGTGVSVQFMTDCASAIAPGTTPTTSSKSPSPTNTGKPSSSSSPGSGPSKVTISSFDTSTTHKILAPLSVALLFPCVLSARAFSPSFSGTGFSGWPIALFAILCYGLGIAGLATSFTSISLAESTLNKRSASSNIHLKTGHGQAALALFIGLYGLVPLLWILSARFNHPGKVTDKSDNLESPVEPEPKKRQRTPSVDTAEKLKSATSRSRTPSRPSSPRQRTQSWGPSILWRPSTDRRLSSDNETISSAGPSQASPGPSQAVSEPPRSFEVVNRPQARRTHTLATDRAPTSLRDVDWLLRRRSLNAFGELDYAITQARRAREREALSTPATNEGLTATSPSIPSPQLPSAMGVFLHILLQVLLIGLAIVCLVVLWPHSIAGFTLFLVWIVAFLVALVVLAWNGKPKTSILAVMLIRLRAEPHSHPPQELNQYLSSQTPPLSAPEHYPFPAEGPYYHEPPFRAATSTDLSHGGPRSVETDDDDDEDEDARQRRIESEMGRRDIVTVTTVPKRKLWIANPS